MAVFMINTCKFGRCGASFPTLRDLIMHIEDTHIDFDPSKVEQYESQQPSSLPLSYVLRVFKESNSKCGEMKKMGRAHSPVSSVCSTGNTPTGSEMDDDFLSESEESCDSWVSKDEFSSEYVLRMLNAAETTTESRPFACPIPGCKKRYKNINGIRCHAKKGHNTDIKFVKCYKCQCGKSYKTSQGLRNHTSTHHCQEAAVKSCVEDFVSVLFKKDTPQKATNSSGLFLKQSATGKPVTGGIVSASVGVAALKDKFKLAARNADHTSAILNALPVVADLVMEGDSKLLSTTAFGSKPPPLSPILQQHLLSPVIPKKLALVKSESNASIEDRQYP